MTSREWLKLSKFEQETIASFHHEFPVKVGALAKSFGVSVKSSTLDAGISGEIKRESDGYVIRVNRHDVKARQRFTLAHEIAHFLLHKESIGDGIVDDILYRSSLSDRMEAQANRLAADILMPIAFVNKKMTELGQYREEERIEKIASLLEVSITALKYRLGK
ncbi:ImmA/IrrE family metallo-endopeptidase [Vibrio vulnificus]|nr:ImmA/IrrE family metallo-endopeptidase [Vibrio vulnificus]EHH1183876.1 ImmA/IrrE family metallo-endopeptidase [Vibrio vulnificus]EHH2485842.1 ImmA/IrrE family metallo-endopeptidase [Vibrio vulnificus]EHI9277231.1 ImmA/IrrE family metallo-endopeptidase [Vibrio vulnificus]EHK9115978.1 ImmA/IrrE family metallo-endopeptidase [Vibrio vulnificus]